VAQKRSTKPQTPDQRVRDLRKEFRTLDDEAPGADRAARLARFTRAAHEDRQLNMAMHTAALCLEDDPEAPELLVAAYAADTGDEEERLAALSDLRDLGRYIDRSDVADAAERLLRDGAHAWVEAADPSERRYRLRTVQSLTSREVADDIRDALQPDR